MSGPPSVDLIDTIQLARLLGVVPETVRRRCRSHEWPHHRIARRLAFTQGDIDAIVAIHGVGPIPRPPEPPQPGSAAPRRHYARYPVPGASS